MQIHEYALMKDVTATLLRPRQPDSMWKAPPLVVMNNFAGALRRLSTLMPCLGRMARLRTLFLAAFR